MSNRLLIAIPSKDRWRANEIHKNTFSFFKHTTFDCRVFVEPEEFDLYAQNGIPKHQLVSMGANNEGLAYAKNQIHAYAVKYGYDYIFKVDDDLRSIRDIDTMNMGHAIKLDRKQRCLKVVDTLCHDAIEIMDTVDYIGGICIMYDRQIYGHWFRKVKGELLVGLNKRFESNYICRTELFQVEKEFECYKGIFEDFHTFFNLIERGYVTCLYGRTAFDVMYVGSNSGGHQCFDRKQLTRQAKQYMEQRFPWVVWKQVQGKAWEWEPDLVKTRSKTKNYAEIS